jgi:CheY-like chemotaxis protein
MRRKQYDLRSIIAAICLFAVVAADLIYGAVKGREYLFSWLGLLLAALAIIALFFDQIKEFSLSPSGGLVVKVRERAREHLEDANAKWAREHLEDANAIKGEPGSAEEVASVVTETITPEALRRAEGATVLWVDDIPDNNRFERKALEAVGLRFVLSTSTEDALKVIDEQNFDLIISDMGRGPLDRRAGYTLLDALRSRGDRTPFIIYMGSSTPKLRAEAGNKGAQGLTDHPNELFQLVLSTIYNRSVSRG